MRLFVLAVLVSIIALQCAGTKKADQDRDAERAKIQAQEAFQELKETTRE